MDSQVKPMQLSARVLWAFFITKAANQAHAMLSAASLWNLSKRCVQSMASGQGSAILTRLARITNATALTSIEDSYDQEQFRDYVDHMQKAQCDLARMCIQHEENEALKHLLDPKSCIDCYRGTEHTPSLLIVALREKNHLAARMLLQYQMNPDEPVKAAFGETYHPPIVEFRNDPEAISLLLEFGAKTDWRDQQGRSLFNELIHEANWEVIKLLHDHDVKLAFEDYAVAIEHKDNLFEHELFNFISALGLDAFPDASLDAAASKHLVSLAQAMSYDETIDSIKLGINPYQLSDSKFKEFFFALTQWPREKRTIAMRAIIMQNIAQQGLRSLNNFSSNCDDE
jgi:hypothetical protein